MEPVLLRHHTQNVVRIFKRTFQLESTGDTIDRATVQNNRQDDRDIVGRWSMLARFYLMGVTFGTEFKTKTPWFDSVELTLQRVPCRERRISISLVTPLCKSLVHSHDKEQKV